MLVLGFALSLALSVSCGGDDDDDDDDEFTFGSSAFDDGGDIPAKYTCDAAKGGNGINPPLAWENPPDDTVVYAITVIDKDASGFGHWGISNILATLSLDEGISPGGTIPSGAFEVLNDFGNYEYDGPCPPEGDGDHEYEFTLWALDEEVPDDTKAGCVNSLLMFCAVHVVISLTFVGMYGR